MARSGLGTGEARPGASLPVYFFVCKDNTYPSCFRLGRLLCQFFGVRMPAAGADALPQAGMFVGAGQGTCQGWLQPGGCRAGTAAAHPGMGRNAAAPCPSRPLGSALLPPGGHEPAWHRAGGAPERYSLIGVMRKACTASICSSLPDRQAEPVRRLVRSTMLKRRSQPLSSSR